ncbi:glycosyltransferase family 2 protein [Mangrovicoccus sp. HB161399]|uniref:glycosyltransferase family 2 protein n=1 Tax=Mangrovicoccus sp. HB161399 TaxID=2720392 RepID=UPI001552F1BE|nr:glycosyltransferase family 2 protein [Mangrovicoccus sp. HB161399]
MTRILLHAGPCPLGAARLQAALRCGVPRGLHWASATGRPAGVRLFMASLDPGHVDPLRAARGLAPEDRQAALAARLREELAAEFAGAETVLVSCDLAGRHLVHPSELARLHGFLAPLGEVELLLQHPEPAAGLAAHWSAQILWGRVTTPAADLATRPANWAAARSKGRPARPELDEFPELERPPHWLDRHAFRFFWGTGFAQVTELPGPDALLRHLGLEDPGPAPAAVSARTLSRALKVNPLIRQALAKGLVLPRRLRARAMGTLLEDGPPLDADRLKDWLAGGVAPSNLLPEELDFDPSGVMAGLLPRMLAAAQAADPGRAARPDDTGEGGASLPAEIRPVHSRLVRSRYAPHDRIAPAVPPEAPFRLSPPRPACAERVIVACAKDEGPYLLEWLAFHRAAGFDRFLVYTNDCSDGTDRMLDLVARHGWLTRIGNDGWRGKSPQQAALNHAVTTDLVRQAHWVLHIDTDEFVNIRTGDGTLDALFAAAPEATHWALTWRLFGSGSAAIGGRPVIATCNRCAPAFCPKPHTAWGIKTLSQQIGVYGKLSCHRPTKPDEARLHEAHWVNGSGQPMGAEISRRGWRSSIATVGYDLVQLNHYPLRSLDGFLVKRQRGRALHVDREIGRNYWIRMDWQDREDRSILRHLPRTEAGIAALTADPEIAAAQEAALAWHRQRASELRADPANAALIAEISGLRLTQSERAAWAMVLDHET